MHFDSLALQDYYFLDSQWLCDMFAHVISSEYNRKEYIYTQDHCMQSLRPVWLQPTTVNS